MARKAVVRRSFWSLTRASATSRRSRWLLSRSSISSGTGGRAGAESLHPGGQQPDGRQHNRNQQDRTGAVWPTPRPAPPSWRWRAGCDGLAGASDGERAGYSAPPAAPRRTGWGRSATDVAETDDPLGLLPPPEHRDAECPRCCACRERLQAGRRLGWRRAEVWRSDRTPCVATREAGIAAAGGADRRSARRRGRRQAQQILEGVAELQALEAVRAAGYGGDGSVTVPSPGVSIGCITSVHVISPVDFFNGGVAPASPIASRGSTPVHSGY